MKKKTQPLTTKEKSQRRRDAMDEIASYVTGGLIVTWRRYETIVRRAYAAGDLIAADQKLLKRYMLTSK